MSIASRITAIEEHIGDVYDTIDYSYDTTGVNKNIINIPKYLKKGYLDIINNGIDTLYNNFPKVSGIGSNLSLTPTYKAPIKLNEIQGDTLQNGTPTPSSPIPIECVTGLQTITIANSDNSVSNTYEVNLGKNLFNSDVIIPNMISSVSTQTPFSYNSSTKELTITNSSNDTYLPAIWGNANYINGINIDVEKNTIYTFHFTASQPDSTLKNAVFGLNKSTNKYEYIETLSQKSTFTFNTGNYDVITFRLGSTATTGTVTTFSNFQLEKGSTATPYSPYFTPIELNKIGDYEDSIKKSTGKNYFNGIYANAFIGGSNGVTFAFADNTRTAIVKVEPNTTYTVKKYQGTGLGNRFTISEYPTILTTQTDMGANSRLFFNSDAKEATITTSSNGNYLYVYVTNDITNIPNLQIEKGPNATDYEPYGKVWYTTENIGKYVFTGNETWETSTYGTNSWTMTNVISTNYDTSKVLIISNIFKGVSNDDRATGGNNKIYFGGLDNVVYIRDTSLTTLTEVRNTTNGNYAYYVRKTPTYTKITNTELIEQLESLNNAKSKDGTTNINVTSEDLSMILNVGVLKGE